MRRRHAPDRPALALAIGVHGALLLLFLTMRPPLPAPVSPTATLTLFDVAPPPPPPPPELPPPPPQTPPPRPALAPSGGSPPTVSQPPPPPPMDMTPQPLAAPQPPVAAITSPFGEDQNVAQLVGPPSVGTGHGTGRGTGAGDGNGDGGKARYARASWIYRPSDAELRRFWPPDAVRDRISGRAVLACQVPRSGRPERCWVVSETPADMGFGAAAVRMSPLFRIKPVLRNGRVLPVPVIVPIAYDIARSRAAKTP